MSWGKEAGVAIFLTAILNRGLFAMSWESLLQSGMTPEEIVLLPELIGFFAAARLMWPKFGGTWVR